MKISEITLDDIKDYCGISGEDSNNVLAACLSAAKAYAVSYTGREIEELDEYDDVSIAIMILTNDNFLFRFSGQGNDKPNPAVENILHMHCKNFL